MSEKLHPVEASSEATTIDSPENTAEWLNYVARQIERRFAQTDESRVCEYVTGLALDSPQLVERIIADREIVRGKYGLPPKEAIDGDPFWYEDYLRDLAAHAGVEIVSTDTTGGFFQDNDGDGAAFFSDGRIAVDIDRETPDAYELSLIMLEHETVHALQRQTTPTMPVEVEEYEAYLAILPEMNGAPASQKQVINRLFSLGVMRSVKSVYNDRSVAAGQQVIPEWSKPEYFLEKVDGIDPAVLSGRAKWIYDMHARAAKAQTKEQT